MAGRSSLRRISSLVLLFLVIVLAVPPFHASALPTPFRGEYYNNRNLSGAPVVVRDDAAINFDWGSGSPGAGINADEFSVRWTNFVNFEAGTYRFTMRTDDGGRLWIDDVLILDRWFVQPATTATVERTIAAGYHSIRMEYFEATAQAVAQLSWEKIGSNSTFPDWRGEYFANPDLSGTPVLVRNDTAVNFNWGMGSPAAEVPADNFSARWTRQVSFAAGTYVFTATADDGIRVKVNATTVIDKWIDQPPTTHTGSIALAAGTHTVVVEYYERQGAAQAQVSWALSGSTGTTVIVVDDLSPGFVRGGNLANFYGRNFGYNNHLWWVWNNTTAAYSWGKWTPALPAAGNYEVQVYIPSRYFGSTSARYRIFHNGTRHDRVVAQAYYYDQWVSLGTYYFNAGGDEYVFLASNTGEPWATRYLGFDAVRFIKAGTTPPPGITPTATPPGPTPTSTPAPCAIMPVLGFGSLWNSNASVRTCLGCPTQPEGGVWMAEEKFQNGTMFWRDDTDVIYVLFKDGTWQQFADTWHAGDPETDPSLVPPAGLYQPRRGFGKLWRENPLVRSQLGWATTEERGFTGSLQPFQNGLMIYSNQLGIYALCNDGRWTSP